MERGYRYSYCDPPEEVLAVIPNWVQALDEEAEPGQDESTIKPDDTQDSIRPTTQHTAADAFFASGLSCAALLRAWARLHVGSVEGLGLYEGEREFVLDDHGWKPHPWGAPTKVHTDAETFPLRVVSRLRSSTTGKRIELTLWPDGTTSQAWTD